MRKGISEIVSAALLLAVAVSVAGVYSQWAPDFSQNATQEVADQTQNQIKCSNAGFDVSSVEYDITGQLSKFNVSNTGTINLNDDIQVTAVNSSQIIAQKTIGTLEVEETQRVELESEKIPEMIVASSQECPRLEVVEEDVNSTK